MTGQQTKNIVKTATTVAAFPDLNLTLDSFHVVLVLCTDNVYF